MIKILIMPFKNEEVIALKSLSRQLIININIQVYFFNQRHLSEEKNAEKIQK